MPMVPDTRTHDPTDPNISAIPEIMMSSTPTFNVAGAVFGLAWAGGA
jgi:hypothetical protein